MKVIKFEADWCGPCKMMKPAWEQVIQMDDIEFEVCDVDADPDLARKYDIMSVPIILLIKDGEVVHSMLGVKRAEEIIAEIKKYE